MVDRRALWIYDQWQKKAGVVFPGPYGPEGDFRAWAYKTVNRFFNEEQVWPEEAVERCCVALGLEPPGPLPYLESQSEDEIICSRCTIRTADSCASVLSRVRQEIASRAGNRPITSKR